MARANGDPYMGLQTVHTRTELSLDAPLALLHTGPKPDNVLFPGLSLRVVHIHSYFLPM